jgi:hypothetical protein
MEKFEGLKAAKEIEKYEDVVQDFFVLWFQHIKWYLQIYIMIAHSQLVNLICQSAVAIMANHYRVLPKTLLPNSLNKLFYGSMRAGSTSRNTGQVSTLFHLSLALLIVITSSRGRPFLFQ